jgi:hypothetical protein
MISFDASAFSIPAEVKYRKNSWCSGMLRLLLLRRLGDLQKNEMVLCYEKSLNFEVKYVECPS